RLGVPLFVALYRRRLNYFLKVKELIDSGVVGEVREVLLEFIQKPYEADKAGKKNWRIDPSISGGGYFVDLAPHQLDLVLLYLGAVQSFEANVENRGGWYEVEDYVDLTMTMRQGAKVKGLWDFSSVDAEEKDRFVIVGAKGSIHFSTFSMTPIRLQIGGKEEIFDIDKPAVIQTPMISHVSSLLLQGKDDKQALADAVEGIRIIESILK
ncbi:MAG: hypothetical protein LBH34_02585, partial [Prevotellaceae bacterium]|nr:hypothetical protein [Prevotellaceae bacterium]